MQEYNIRAGQLAVAKGGKVLFSHAYTNAGDLSYGETEPTSIMRVASNSKALVCAAITKLYSSGTLRPTTLVYPYLGVTRPLLTTQSPDPRSNRITVQELVDHTAGLDPDSGPAPEFHMWAIETAAGLSGPLSDAQLTAYLYGEPLNSTPGTTYAYSNDGYYLLARVIERAAEMPYIDWVNANVLAPIGIADAVVSATAFSGRRSNEVEYDDPEFGPSVLTPQVGNDLPYTYGGITVYEDLDGPVSIAISAQSLAMFAGSYNVYGLGPRHAGATRLGSFYGTTSWMESLGDGFDYAFIFNKRVDRFGNIFDITPLTGFLEGRL